MSQKSIVLVGGGHAHLQVIKALNRKAVPNISVTLIDPDCTPSYSGMVPGCVAGLYTQEVSSLLPFLLLLFSCIVNLYLVIAQLTMNKTRIVLFFSFFF